MTESGTTRPEWVKQAIEVALDNARSAEREARRLRKIARTMLDPPPGTSFRPGAHGTVLIYTEIKP